jgi:hypothetical protein
MKPPRVQCPSVSNLRGYLDEGRFAVPKLQREFVWNGRKAAQLLDSMYRNMPIGSLIIWDARRSARDILRKNLNILPPYKDRNGRIWFLIDGQQRLSVIYQAFQGESKRNADRKEVNFSNLTFALGQPRHSEAARFHYRRPVEGEFVSVQDLLSSRWRSKLRSLGQQKLERARECRETLLAYRVPVVLFETSSLDEAKELFIRINSLGTPVSAADRIFSRASQLELRWLAHEAWEGLPEGFRPVPYEAILQALALVEGSKDVAASSYERIVRVWEREGKDTRKKKKLLKRWAQLRKAFGKATDYVRKEFSVLESGYLPSSYMLSLLSVFFFYRKGSRPGPIALIATPSQTQRPGTGTSHLPAAFASVFCNLARGDAVRPRGCTRSGPATLRRSSG